MTGGIIKWSLLHLFVALSGCAILKKGGVDFALWGDGL